MTMQYLNAGFHEVTYIDAESGAINFSTQFTSNINGVENFGIYIPKAVYGIKNSSGNYRIGFVNQNPSSALAYTQAYLEFNQDGEIVVEYAW